MPKKSLVVEMLRIFKKGDGLRLKGGVNMIKLIEGRG